MSLRQELEDLDRELKKTIEFTRLNWIEQQRDARPGISDDRLIPAERARTFDGKPLLADLLVARANVLIALVNLNRGM